MSGGTLKKNTSLRIVWTAEHIGMFLDLWEEKNEAIRGSRKNSHVYQEMAAAMQNAGFNGTWTDIRTKLDNLTRKYKIEKNKIGPTGGTPSNWELYSKVHNILGSFKLHNIELSMHESTDMTSLISEAEDFIEYDPNAPCSSFCQRDFEATQTLPPKRKRVDTNTKLLKLAEERLDILKKQQEVKQNQVNEMLKRLDTISNQNAEFQTKLLSILKEK